MHLDLSSLLQVGLQLRKRDVLHGTHLLLQESAMLGRETGRSSAAVRMLCQVAGLSMLAEHLLDEGLSDTKAHGNLSDGIMALLVSVDDALA